MYTKIIEIKNLINGLPQNKLNIEQVKKTIETSQKPRLETRIWIFVLSEPKHTDCTELKELRKEFFKHYKSVIFSLYGYKKIKVEKKQQFINALFQMKRKDKIFSNMPDTLFLKLIKDYFEIKYKINTIIKKYKNLN